MNKILLIGAGQLGSRHLQGLAKIKIDANIFIVDPSSDSMNNAKIRLNEISDRNTRNGYYFYPTITEVPKDIDLAIIATNSDVRKKVLVDLFKNKNVKSIILEKFLFQNELDFFDIEKILIEKKINAWVNCARRMYPEFQELKETLKEKKILDISVKGSNWAMGSNSIHFIDLFAFLTSCENYSIQNIFLLDYLFENKRSGFTEYNGELKGKFVNGTNFSIVCLPKDVVSIEIQILLKDEIYIINQLEQKINIQKIIDGKWIIEEKDFKAYFQSNLTTLAVSRLLSENYCDLTTYSSSMKLHLPILSVFLSHYNKIKNDYENRICPIT